MGKLIDAKSTRRVQLDSLVLDIETEARTSPGASWYDIHYVLPLWLVITLRIRGYAVEQPTVKKSKWTGKIIRVPGRITWNG